MWKDGIQLGIAPIGWTNDDMPALGGGNTFEQCISEMALAGFTGCEVGSKYPSDTAVLKEALELRGLRIASKWFSSFLATRPLVETERAFLRELDYLEALGANRINVSEQSHSIQGDETKPVLMEKPCFTETEWEALCHGLNHLGRLATERGFRLCFHHHMGTGVQTVAETERLLTGTNPGHVFLCFDSGHFTFSGEDPMDILQRFPHRIGHVHLKDVRPAVLAQVRKEGWSFLKAVREGVFTVPGDGCVDFGSIFAALEASGYQGWLLVEAEQDPEKANPFRYAKMARAAIRGMLQL